MREGKRMGEGSGVSCCILTCNEEKEIEGCIRSVEWADEVIVVDCFSTDGTLEAAQRAGARVVQRRFDDFVSQRNYALSLASRPWVLFVDADERVTDPLRDEILSALEAVGEDVAAFSIPRRSFFLGKFLKHGDWGRDRVVRLFRKERGRWVGGPVHEHVEVDGVIVALQEKLLHFPYDNVTEHIERMNRYTTLAARGMLEEGRRASPLHFLRAPWRFFSSFVVRGGFLDGVPGFVCAVMSAFYVFLKYLKLWEARQNEDTPRG